MPPIARRSGEPDPQPRAGSPVELTVNEAAPLLGLAPSYVRHLAASGELRARKRGRSWVVRESDVLTFERRPTRCGRARKGAPRHAAGEREPLMQAAAAIARAAVVSGPDQVAALTVQSCAAALGADLAAVWWRSRRPGRLHVLAASRVLPAGPWPVAGAAGDAIRGSRPVALHAPGAGFLPWEQQAGFESTVAVPLTVAGQTVGALQAWSRSPGGFTPAQVEGLRLIAGVAAPILELRRRTEAALEEGRRFRGLFEQASIGQALLALDGRYLRVNRVYREMLGYSAAQLRAMDVFATTHPEDRERNRQLLAALVDGSLSHYELEKRHVRPDGRVIDVAVSASLARDPDGRPTHVLGLMQDITARKEAERELEASRQHLAEVLNSAPVTLFATDAAGVIVFAEGDGLTDAIGHGPEQVIGHSIFELYPSLLTEPGIAEAFSNPESLKQGGRLQVALGTAHLECRVRPIWNESGALTGFTGIATDVSDRVRAEAAHLESQQKSRFLATMSHELRTPLNSVLGFSQLLHSGGAGPLNPKQSRYVANIMSSGAHLLQLINDVLDLSKVLAGRMEADIEDLPVGMAVRDTVAKMQPLVDAKGQALEVEVDETLRVAADRRHLDQVLLNLVSNAVKFTQAGGRLSISTRPGRDAVQLLVADDGIGIPPEHLESIFEEFTQVDSGMGRSREGTGLGLPLSRRLARGMGGDITVSSLPGVGSTFTLTLPAARGSV